jgi:hypothetical protein
MTKVYRDFLYDLRTFPRYTIRMCISAETSLSTFVVSIVSSIALIYYGNPKYKNENMVVGIFFIYVVFMQLLEYMIWIDLDNIHGLNKIASTISPLFIISQPMVLLLCSMLFMGFENNRLLILNICYLAYEIYCMIPYYQNESRITKEKNGHLNWGWNKYFSPFFIFIISLNILEGFPLYYALLFFISGVSMFVGSYKIDLISYNSLWCWMVGFIPLIMLIGSHYV